ALRSYVLRVAWEHDQKLPSTNAGFVMNFSTDVIQEVTKLNMELHGAAGYTVDAHAAKLVRDAIIWSHLAGDSVQRMKVVRQLARSSPSGACRISPLGKSSSTRTAGSPPPRRCPERRRSWHSAWQAQDWRAGAEPTEEETHAPAAAERPASLRCDRDRPSPGR